MNIFRRLRITTLVALYALFPDRRGTDRTVPHAAPPVGPTEVHPHALRSCLADLPHCVRNDGTLALFFPDCLAAAAPFLLFRLKRCGFSGCRAVATPAGLSLAASR